MIHIVSARSKLENVQKRYPEAVILDITSNSLPRSLWAENGMKNRSISVHSPFTAAPSATA